MNKIYCAIIACLLMACNDAASDNTSKQTESAATVFRSTLYQQHIELYTEAQPMLLNEPSQLIIHASQTDGTYRPLKNAAIMVSLVVGDKGVRNKATQTSTPGIYMTSIRPSQSGMGRMVISLSADSIQQEYVIDSVQVYAQQSDIKVPDPATNAFDVSFSKEQAWQTGFEIDVVKPGSGNAALTVTGELESKPGDETVIASQSAGTVRFIRQDLVEGAAVPQGQQLFSIGGNDIVSGNIDQEIKIARLEAEEARAEYERLEELLKDQLVLRSEHRKAKLNYESATLRLRNLQTNYGAAGKVVSAPASGFIRELLVNNGNYVSEGQPLAILTKNKKLLLKADLPLRDVSLLNRITDADFILPQTDSAYNIKKLNGRLLGAGKSTAHGDLYVPLYFEFDNLPGLIPGSRVSIYLRYPTERNTIVLPSAALIEEYGSYYVFVQKEGESFEKRAVKVMANNASDVEVLDGLRENERVVVQGAYRVKLASQAGSMPAHDHQH